ncbi:MAG TPA: hypothetical protein VMT55_04960 [Candidatus Sulfotelmatobacter sp.]|nr:hypothetical protein [Candidatus Sulfotelmatobacter sp.]
MVLQQSPIVTFGYVVQVVFSLAIVLALIYFSAKLLLPRLRGPVKGSLIQIVDRVYLEPQVASYVLKVGRRSWLIVASSKNVEKIAELEAESPSA